VKSITHYDVTNLDYSGYFAVGLRANARNLGYRYNVSRTLPTRLSEAAAVTPGMETIAIFEAKTSDQQFWFCIDGHDINSAYRIPILEHVQYYFKVNYDREAITSNEELEAFQHKILPTGPSFPIRVPRWQYRPSLSGTRWEYRRNWGRLCHLSRLGTLERLIHYRTEPKTRDVAFIVPYYNENQHTQANEFRYEVMEQLGRRANLHADYGFVGHVVPDKFKKYHVERVSPQNHLQRLASSRVAIYVRGLHDCVSYKFGEMLSLGLPIAGQTVRSNSEMLGGYPHFTEQFSYDEPDALVDRVEELIADPDSRSSIACSNMNIFDAHLSPVAVTREILRTICM